MDLLDFLDPDAVVGDVKVVEDVGGVILSEDLVDIQQALQDTGLAWKKRTGGGKEKKRKREGLASLLQTQERHSSTVPLWLQSAQVMRDLLVPSQRESK